MSEKGLKGLITVGQPLGFTQAGPLLVRHLEEGWNSGP